MVIKGLDYAWAHVPPSAVAQYGDFVCRYLSGDISKNLGKAEAADLASRGVWCVVVYETVANRATAGFAAGASDAAKAQIMGKALDMPASAPIYFAVDFDSDGRDVKDYFAGVISVLGVARTGVYGGIRAVSYLHRSGLVRWVWQTYAWSGGAWYTTTHIRQVQNDIVIGGVGCDADVAFPDAKLGHYGQWMPNKSPISNPVPAAKDDDMPFGQLAEGPKGFTPIALPKGKYTKISFLIDNGVQGLPPASIRVAECHGANLWHVSNVVILDSTKDQAVVMFFDPINTTGLSIIRNDEGNAHVGWEVS